MVANGSPSSYELLAVSTPDQYGLLFAISRTYLIRYATFTPDHLYQCQLVKLLDH